MPPTDAGSTRRPPTLLAAIAGALLLARVAYGVIEMRHAPERPSLVEWRAVEAGEAEASRRGTLALYDFSAEWCGPCKRLDADVFADPRLAAQINARFVPIRVTDRQREEGRNPPAVDSLQRRYAVDSFPTLVIVDPKSGRFERHEGHAGRTDTAQWIVTTAMKLSGAAFPLGAPVPPGGRADSVITR